ncbi:MAG TPA: branched-chain amino acid ABC transporter permease [Dehalococcoidia bacterium]|nr:branched-chain amino acid ABC transporter permease [Dehalococcoidia bacterium]
MNVLAVLPHLASYLLAPQPWDNLELFFDQSVAGIATGSIYGLVALGIVLIYRSTDVINFAQGELALFVTFCGWSMIEAGYPYLAMFALVILIAGGLGAFLERTVIRPVEGAPVLNVVIVTLGLFVIFNSLTAFIWAQGELPKSFPATPIGTELETFDFGILTLQQHRVAVIIISVIVAACLYLLFNRTKLGLAMRGTAQNRVAAQLMGINTGRMLMLGWALSAMVGAVGGMLVAPIIFLDLTTMLRVILFAFAAAVLGGLDSPPGAMIGGITIGITQNILSTFALGPVFFGPQLALPAALLVLVLVLLIRPTGLFGRHAVRRV